MPSDADRASSRCSSIRPTRCCWRRSAGAFTRQITIDLDTAARALQVRHGPFAVVLDFTKVTELAIQLRDWPQFAADRRAIRGTRRIIVAPPNDTFSSAAPVRHATRWRRNGDSDVVSTRDQAFRQLGLKSPAFEPVVPAQRARRASRPRITQRVTHHATSMRIGPLSRTIARPSSMLPLGQSTWAGASHQGANQKAQAS